MNANRGLRLGHEPPGSWSVRIQLDRKRPTRAFGELHPVAATRTERRLLVQLNGPASRMDFTPCLFSEIAAGSARAPGASASNLSR